MLKDRGDQTFSDRFGQALEYNWYMVPLTLDLCLHKSLGIHFFGMVADVSLNTLQPMTNQ